MKILRGGCASKHDKSFVMSRPNGQDNYVILLLRSKGTYLINDIPYHVYPGHTIIIAPRTPYRYHDPAGNYSDDWIHFQFEEGEALPNSLRCNVPFLLADFETCATLIRQLLWEHTYTSSVYAAENINALFSVLFNHLSAAYHSQENIESGNRYLQSFKLLRLQMQSTLADDHSINKHSAEFCISTSHFQHLYSQFFGISFQNDLIRMRIANAKTLLQETNFSMETIAEACGYANCVHFYRQFKQIEGTTPANYRKKSPSLETV